MPPCQVSIVPQDRSVAPWSLGVTAFCVAVALVSGRAAPAGAVLAIETKMAPPRVGGVGASRSGREHAGTHGVLQEVLRRPRLRAVRAALGRRRWSRRRLRKLCRLARVARARRERRRVAPVPQGPRRDDRAIHRGQDDRRAGGPGRHVLQGVQRPGRLDASRRRIARVQPDGSLPAERHEIPGACPAFRRVLHGRGYRGGQLRSGAQADSEPDQRQPRADVAEGHADRLGRRSDRYPELQGRSRRAELRRNARALCGVRRRGRRFLPESRRDHPAAGRLPGHG